MKLKKVLWKYEPHKDGRCDIKFYTYHNKKTKVYSSGISILPEQWDEQRSQVKSNHPLAQTYNHALQKLHLELEEHFFKGGNFKNFRQKEESVSLIDYCSQVIQKGEKGLLSLTPGTIRNYKATFRRLNEYSQHYRKPDLSLNTIDMDFYQQFSDFLIDHGNCNLPGISKHIKIIKRLMAMSLEENLHNNHIFRSKAFKRPRSKPSSKIYLTTDEITKIEQLELSGQPILERERDRFLLSYWLLMRFSDVNLVSDELLFSLNDKQFLRYQSVKTEVEVTLPLYDSAIGMMQKHNFDFSFYSNIPSQRWPVSILTLPRVGGGDLKVAL